MNSPDINRDPSLGLIGCGYWGKNLARNFHALGALHSICESDANQREAFRKIYPDVVFHSEVSDLLADDNILQIAIAAPAVQHHSLARVALLAGKDVFVEKPLCLTVKEGQDLKQIAEKASKILMVGHLLQYHPAICKLQEMIDQGVFGKVFRITSRRLNLGKVRSEENAFWSLAPHDISVILSLLPDAIPDRVQSTAETYLQKGISDCSHTNIQFSNGTNAEIQVSWLHPYKEQKLCIIGKEAMAVFDDTRVWDKKLYLRRNYFDSSKIEPVPLSPEEPLRNECLHFLNASSSGEFPKTDAAEGVRVLEILEAAQSSADQGGITIKLS